MPHGERAPVRTYIQSQSEDTGHRRQDTGFMIHDSRYRIQDTGRAFRLQ